MSAHARPQKFIAPPMPAQSGDGNEWVTGRCWLYCLRADVLVIWIGPVQVGGASAPAFACGPCIRTITDLAWDELMAKDRFGVHAAT